MYSFNYYSGCQSLTPDPLCSLQAIFLFFLIKYKPLKYNNVYTYPDWGYGIGWFMAMSSMVCIPFGVIWMIWKTPGTFSEVKTTAEPRGER